jgi:isopentenyl diphosphate isomerase/L-lactate dehydrogenase-like FMN-dependent dehydrogenase
MLKKTITYQDYNGKELTEDFYFNLSKAELVELELSREGGLMESLQKIIADKDGAVIIAEFKKIVLQAYGEKSADGKRFIKNDEVREAFSQTEAYSQLFFELATNDGAAAAFIQGIVPEGLNDVKDAMETIAALPETASDEPATEELPPLKQFAEYSEDELLDMPQQQFERLVPRNVKDMTKEQLSVAFQRRSASKVVESSQ